MFGKNPKRGVEKGDGSFLQVQTIFKTLQGEGPNTGVPSIFLRLGGCNLACDFCDTEFEDYKKINTIDIIKNIQSLSINKDAKQTIFLVVITGGEPLRQEINPLCKELLSLGFKVQIETNGTLYRSLPEEVEIICSPKVSAGKYLSIRPDLLPNITALKFLISKSKVEYSNVPDLGQKNYNIEVFVQPMDQYKEDLNIENKKLAVDIAINNGYRLSYQIHKELNIE
ncbi:MAG: hypothetical protein DGJ47_000576 [Rickettsiaceae bacterium]